MNDLETQINQLLFKTGEISRRFAEVEKTTGAGFNLLHLLNMGHYETKTHTPILTDLLNPKGSHGQGGVFLKLFLSTCFGEDSKFLSATEGTIVTEEKYIGRVDHADASGGRIDIHLQSANGDELLAIENKIHAEEQDQQIQRYLNHVDQLKEKGRVIYLTLDGQASGSYTGEKPTNLFYISYQAHIVDWLRLCRKEVATIPIIRESLTVYINLICDLTNQSPNQEMNEKIIEAILNSPSDLAAYSALPKTHEVQQAIFEGKIEKMKQITESRLLTFSTSESPVYYKDFGFSFESINWLGFDISFNFEAGGCSNLSFGFHDAGKMPEADREKLFDLTTAKLRVEKSSHWPAWQWWTKYQNWNGETLSEVAHGDFLKDLKEKIDTLKKIGDEFASDSR